MTRYSPIRPRGPASRAWMVTFADLLSLLLAFFVLLFAMSAVETNAWKTFADTLSNRLNPLHLWTRPQVETDRAAPRAFAARVVDLDYLSGILRAKMADSKILNQTVLHRLDHALVISLPEHLIFAPGQTRLQDGSQQNLEILSTALKSVGNSVELIGHTDTSQPPPDGPFNSNWDLSLARALALANGLRAAGYVDPIKVLGVADGGYQDISSRLPQAQRLILSRRVDLVIRETAVKGASDAP